VTKTTLLLCLWGHLALASASTTLGDAPVLEQRVRLRPAAAPRAARRPCLICATSDSARTRPSRVSPFLLAFHVVFKLDAYLYASGLPPPQTPLSRALQLSLIAPSAGTHVSSREPRDLESLSVYVLELGDYELAATARQQSRGGFWGKLEVGERIYAEASGFLTRRGSNATGADWFATHLLEVRSNGFPLWGIDPPVFFGLLSLENALARDHSSFTRFAAMPGLGLGLRWKTAAGVLTATTGVNAGLWFVLKGGATAPAFALNLQSVQLEL
jgi:hypothetical protein